MMIPKKFSLTFRNYKVITVHEDIDEGKEIYGHIDPTENKVVIAETVEGKHLDDVERLTTFNHELVHGILRAMGEQELYNDERFVEGFAQLLTQYELTRKY